MPFGLEIMDENGVVVFNADGHRGLRYAAELTPVGYQFYGSNCLVHYLVPEQYRNTRHLIHLVNGNDIVRGDTIVSSGIVSEGVSYSTNDYTQEQLKAALKPVIVVSL
ncbi:hypothetical protein [Acinetobacter lactucae]|uniref:Uncharacterized protein n=1 Tax=Acinetobacter lactucae TaxID=1785128 RepID=R8YZT7_9GAMM|nr:hypothetical protein [Acinetobacter lactucae]EOQ73017.1 hypothetical protein F929_02952 [Acinetobacter lactucae]